MLFPCRIVRFSDDKAAVGSNHHVLSIDRFSIFDLLQEAFRDARCTFNSGTTFEVRIIIRRTCLDPVTFLPASVADVTLRRGSLGLAIGTVGRVGVGSRSGSSWCVEGAVLSAFIEPVLTTATISESHVPTYSGCSCHCLLSLLPLLVLCSKHCGHAFCLRVALTARQDGRKSLCWRVAGGNLAPISKVFRDRTSSSPIAARYRARVVWVAIVVQSPSSNVE